MGHIPIPPEPPLAFKKLKTRKIHSSLPKTIHLSSNSKESCQDLKKAIAAQATSNLSQWEQKIAQESKKKEEVQATCTEPQSDTKDQIASRK